MAVCTGCSLLCEDIELTVKPGALSQVKNLCRKGHAYFQALFTERTKPMADGNEASADQAIAVAAEILRSAKNPLLCGWTNSSLEAQKVGIDLARRLSATINDCSSSCQGTIMERVLKGSLPTCSFDDVRNFADTSLFWGCDPSNSHPRLLSRFAYYPRGSKRQKSYEEERTCMVVDVKKSSTARLCLNYYFRVAPGGDAEFTESILAVLDGKIPKFGDKKRMIELGTVLRKTEFGAIFPGPGMALSLQNRMDLFEQLLAKLNSISSFKAIPMAERYNTRGFNQLLLEQTGFIDAVSFRGEAPAHGPEQSLARASKSCDAVLAIGCDPLSELAGGVARLLARVPVIAIDPRRSLTTDVARVVIPSAIYGLEARGSAIRSDGVKIEFEPVVSTELMTDEQILKRILEAI